MKIYLFLFLFSFLSLNPDDGLENRVAQLEKEVKDLTDLIINNDIRSRLSFGLNRSLIYNGNYYAAFTEDSTEYVYHFDGYLSNPNFEKKYKEQKIELARHYVHKISEIILGQESEWYDAVLEIKFYDTIFSKEPFVTASTKNKLLKVRLAGIMTEISWD